MSRTLLVGKAEQIQRYLLASPRLNQIRGGSYLLVRLERETARIVEGHGGETLCAAGGVLTASFGDRAEAERALHEVRSLYSLRAPGLRFRATTHTGTDPDFGKRHGRARQRLAQVPDAAGLPAGIPFLLPCDVCGRQPARQTLKRPDEPAACVECWARDQADRDFEVELERAQDRHRPASRDDGISPRAWLERELQARGASVRVQDDGRKGRRARRIEDVAIGRPPGYVGYIAADGNGIGTRLAGLGHEGSDPEAAYRAFSKTLDEATRTALIEAVDACRKRYERSARPGLAENPPLKVLPVVAGGDDLLVLCPPSAAVLLALAFARAFEAATTRGQAPLSTGLGVVIAHASTPFAHLDEQAHEAQRAAKRLSRGVADGRRPSPSAIGLRILRGGPATGPEEVRRGHFAGIGAYLVDDPDSALDAGRLIEAAWTLAESRPPWSRLRRVDDILQHDDDRAAVELDILLGPLGEEQQKALRAGAAPPRGYSGKGVWLSRPSDGGGTGDVRATPLPDLLALAELL